MFPLLLKPIAKDYLWGGTRLKEEFNKDSDYEIVAETWECSVHPDGLSVIVNGKYSGKTLKEVIKLYPEIMGEKYCKCEELPIMIKFIDAAKNLSVQVHPNDEYARMHENQNGKTEMWYILDASDDAKLIYGFEKGVSKDKFVEAIKTGKIMDCLQQVPINKGESYLIPAGTVHAIGAGTLIAEIQENSNVTYRLYDYDRIDKNGNKRELHLDKALEVALFDTPSNNASGKELYSDEAYTLVELTNCEYFTVNKYDVKKSCCINVGNETFQVLLCVDGDATIECADKIFNISKGQCIFLPAGIGRCDVIGTVEILNVIG